MKKNIFILVSILCLTAIVITYGVLLFRNNHSSKTLTLYGNVDIRQVDISFRVAGQVNHLAFEEGDHVKEGDFMCSLTPSPYDSLVDEAKASLEAIEVKLNLAKILLDRRRELISIGGVSQEDLDDAEANYVKLVADLEQAKAALTVAEDNLTFTKAFAPTDGIILTRIREPGTVVNPSDPVFTLSISSPVWIRAFVDEPDLGKVYYGMKAEVFTDSGRQYEGRIGFISPVAEFTPKTVQTVQLRSDLVYRLRIYVDNPDVGLIQGMPVTVKIKLDE